MQPLVELVDLSFGYDGKLVLEDINLALPSGQFMALVGPSGAGKTTLLKLVLRLLQPVSGQINHRAAPRMKMAYVPQLETVDWNFPVTAEEVVLMGNTRQTQLWPWPNKRERHHARALMQELEIGDLAMSHIRDLSGGQQQRVFLARALMAAPDLPVVDEPTSGVDMRSADHIFHLLGDLNQRGMTILLTTHDLNMAAAHVLWVVCINRKVVAQGTPTQIFTDSILSQTYQGEMQVVHHEGTILIHQRPHRHGETQILTNPVAAKIPAASKIRGLA